MAGHGGNSSTVIFKALIANLGIAIAKFVGAFFTGSASMLAEAIHSLVDSTNQVLLLVGSNKSKKPPTERHPLGFGREAFFWSFIVAILLFSMGGLFAIYEGVHKLTGHSELTYPAVGFGILLLSIALEAYSFHACLVEVRNQNRYGSLWKWLRQTTSSELLVVFTEDAAALSGLIIATVCLLLAWVTGNPVWDAVGSILVGVVLVVVAIFLAAEIKSLIIGEAPGEDLRSAYEAELTKHIPGGKVLRFIGLQVGADETLVSLKISPGEIRETSVLIDRINSLEAAMRTQFPQVRWQFVEPDNEA